MKKKFRSVKKDVKTAVEVLLENPELGAEIQGGSGVRKLRVKNSDLKRGKSGGYRLIYCIDEEKKYKLYLLLLYSKSDQENISENELKKLIEEIADQNEIES